MCILAPIHLDQSELKSVKDCYYLHKTPQMMKEYIFFFLLKKVIKYSVELKPVVAEYIFPNTLEEELQFGYRLSYTMVLYL